MTTLERLAQILGRDFGLQPEALHASATLESLEIDSLRMIEILFSVEDEFHVTVPNEHAEIRARVQTLGDLATFIDELVAQQPKTP